MFAVNADSVAHYLAFDPQRAGELAAVDEVIRTHAPALTRWLKRPDPTGSPGMRMTLLGYGAFHYRVPSKPGEGCWPILGLALQKHHLSLYCAARDDDGPLSVRFAERLAPAKVSRTGAVTFTDATELDLGGLAELVASVAARLEDGTLRLGVRATGTFTRFADPPDQG